MRKRLILFTLVLFLAACGDSDTARTFLAPSWTPAITSECTVWDADTVYNGGSTVIYEDQGYQAKWWTRGENPTQSGQWDVWKETDVCDAASDDGSDDGTTTDGGTDDTGADDTGADDTGANDTGADDTGTSGADDSDTGADDGADGSETTGADNGTDSGEATGADDGGDTSGDDGSDSGDDGDTGADTGTDDGTDGGEGEEKIIEGDVEVTTQADLDVLVGVTEIVGSLFIETDAESLDFSPLDNLQSVGVAEPEFKALVISGNTALKEVSGFGALENVSRFFISSNDALETVTGFENLRSAELAIVNNASLETLPVFNSLYWTRDLRIRNNPSLTRLSGFPELTDVFPDSRGYQMRITDNEGLEVIDAFDKVNSKVIIENNKNLESITGLAKSSDIAVRNNESLSSITGFNETTDVSRIELDNNPLLADVSGFSSLEFLRFLDLKDLPALTDLSPFSGMTEVSDVATIDNIGARSFAAFEGVYIRNLYVVNYPDAELTGSDNLELGSLTVTDNPKVTTISGFNSVNLVYGLEVTDNPELVTVSGFNDIEVDFLDILSNPELTTISGFDNVNEILITAISENERFDCSISPQAELSFLPLDSSEGNAVNCPTKEE